MKVYNTLSRRKEELVPIDPSELRMYVCGPTVYNYIHIGNARPFVVFDTMRKYLEYRGQKVKFVQKDDAGHTNVQYFDLSGLTLLTE